MAPSEVMFVRFYLPGYLLLVPDQLTRIKRMTESSLSCLFNAELISVLLGRLYAGSRFSLRYALVRGRLAFRDLVGNSAEAKDVTTA